MKERLKLADNIQADEVIMSKDQAKQKGLHHDYFFQQVTLLPEGVDYQIYVDRSGKD